MKYLITFLTLINGLGAIAQNVGIGTASPNPSAQLDVSSTTKGVLIPRMTKAQRTSIVAPANGLLVFQHAPDSVGFYYFNTTSWVWLQNATTHSNIGWGTTGNAGTDASVNFIGTTDYKPLQFRLNGEKSGLLDFRNLALGYRSMEGRTAGVGNIALGPLSMRSNQSSDNVAIGHAALNIDTTGSFNTALGTGAMTRRTHGNRNVAVGSGSMFYNKSNNNVAVGSDALSFDTTGTENTALGYRSMNYRAHGENNVAVGAYSMYNNKSNYNVAVGSDALRFDTTGTYNTALGFLSMNYRAHGENNVAVGAYSMYSNKSNENVAIGKFALFTDTTGSFNTALGNESLISSANSVGAVAIGFQAAFSDTAAKGTVAIGRAALYHNISKAGTVAIGDSALFYNGLETSATEALYNTAIGNIALFSNTSGTSNTATGYHTLLANVTGDGNTALGAHTLQGMMDGNNNVAIGVMAASQNVSGDKNVAIGHSALFSNTASGNVAIGYKAGFFENGANKLYIENSDANKGDALIYGDFAADSVNLNAQVNIKKFTRLGSPEKGAPAIKMKKIVIPAGPAVDGSGNYPFGDGIIDGKVLAIDVLMQYSSASSKIPPGYNDAAGYEYHIQVQFNGVTIINKIGNSANIGGKPITVLVTYEE